MKTINVRGIDDTVFSMNKNCSKENGESVNRYIVEMLGKFVGKPSSSAVEFHDLDGLFGTLSDEEADAMLNAVAEQRKIDPELWQ